MLGAYFIIDMCKYGCNCPTESVCIKPCESLLSVFKIESCPFSLDPFKGRTPLKPLK